MIQVPLRLKQIIEIICRAIREKKVIEFHFESDSGNKGLRKIKPYMVYINDKDEIKVAGLPRELWNIKGKKQPRHYLLEKINLNELEVLEEKFNDPGVPREIVVATKIVRIICRFIYDDEDEKEIMPLWQKIKYV